MALYGQMPVDRPTPSGNLSHRLAYFILPTLVIALVGGSLYWLQWASQRGLALGYPKPVVHISSTPSGPTLINTSAQFSAGASGREVTYTWDFGDGTSGEGATANHVYQSNGTFTVTVHATDGINQTSSDTTTVHVVPPPPTASFTYSSYYYSYYVYFDASGSSADRSTSIASYSWNFGDGSTDTTSYSQDNHQYANSGTYQVSLTVTDATGQTSSPYTTNISI